MYETYVRRKWVSKIRVIDRTIVYYTQKFSFDQVLKTNNCIIINLY